MFKKLCKEIEIEFIGSKLDSEEKTREWQRKINNIEIWDMRFLENYIAEFSQYYYKIGHNDINLGMFYDKLPYPINSIINVPSRLTAASGGTACLEHLRRTVAPSLLRLCTRSYQASAADGRSSRIRTSYLEGRVH